MKTVSILLVGMLIVCVVANAQSDLKWINGPEMSESRTFPCMVHINDSTAIVAGGWKDNAFGTATNTCDIVQATQQGVFVLPAPSMKNARAEYPAYRVGDTAVVVFGGVTTGDRVLRDVELYDIRSNSWRVVGRLSVGRRQHVAFPMSETKFLIVGGRSQDLTTLSSAEVFDLSTGQSTPVMSFPQPINGSIGTFTSLGTGVVFGGRDGGPNGSRYSEVYAFDFTNNSWNAVSQLSAGREAPMSCRLRSGSVVVAAGAYSEEPLVLCREVIVESANSFQVVSNSVEGRLYCAIAEYRDNEIVLAGGQGSDAHPINRTQFINAKSGRVIDGPNLNSKRSRARGIALRYRGAKSGNPYTVVVVGGDQSLNGGSAQRSIEYLDRTCSSSTDLLSTNSLISLVGTAQKSIATPSILLTGLMPMSAGAAWFNGKMIVQSGVSTTFSFRLLEGADNNQPDGGYPGADGVAFVIQNHTPRPLGKSGQGLGYEGIENAVVVEFDAYLNSEYSDPSGNHVALQASKATAMKPWHREPYLVGITHNTPVLRSDGTIYYAKIDFSVAGVEIYLDTVPSFSHAVLSIPTVQLSEMMNLDSDGAAWIGLTSATGFSVQKHEILTWTIEGCEPMITAVEPEDSHTDDSRTALGSPDMPSISSDFGNRAVLSWNMANSASRLSIFNSGGELVWRQEVTKESLLNGVELPIMPVSGVYHLTIVNDNVQHCLRWLVHQ